MAAQRDAKGRFLKGNNLGFQPGHKLSHLPSLSRGPILRLCAALVCPNCGEVCFVQPGTNISKTNRIWQHFEFCEKEPNPALVEENMNKYRDETKIKAFMEAQKIGLVLDHEEIYAVASDTVFDETKRADTPEHHLKFYQSYITMAQKIRMEKESQSGTSGDIIINNFIDTTEADDDVERKALLSSLGGDE